MALPPDLKVPGAIRLGHVRHRLDPVDDQVQYHLLELDPIAPHDGQVLGDHLADCDPMPERLRLDEREGVADHVPDVQACLLATRPPQQRARMREQCREPLFERGKIVVHDVFSAAPPVLCEYPG